MFILIQLNKKKINQNKAQLDAVRRPGQQGTLPTVGNSKLKIQCWAMRLDLVQWEGDILLD